MEEKKDVKPGSVYMRKWREKKGEAWKEYMRKWRANHKAQVKANRKSYYQRTRQVEIDRAKNWASENPEKAKNIGRARKATIKYSGSIDAAGVKEIFERDNYTCYWCGKSDLKGRDLTLEHLEPINCKDKLKTACGSCNSARLHCRPEAAKRRRQKEQ